MERFLQLTKEDTFNRILDGYRDNLALLLGFSGVICGVLSMALTIAGLAIHDGWSHFSIFTIANGLWCGAFFVIAGCVTMAASRKPTFYLISLSVLFSGISAIFGIIQVLFECGGISWSFAHYKDPSFADIPFFGAPNENMTLPLEEEEMFGDLDLYLTKLGLHASIMAFTLAELFVCFAVIMIGSNARAEGSSTKARQVELLNIVPVDVPRAGRAYMQPVARENPVFDYSDGGGGYHPDAYHPDAYPSAAYHPDAHHHGAYRVGGYQQDQTGAYRQKVNYI